MTHFYISRTLMTTINSSSSSSSSSTYNMNSSYVVTNQSPSSWSSTIMITDLKWLWYFLVGHIVYSSISTLESPVHCKVLTDLFQWWYQLSPAPVPHGSNILSHLSTSSSHHGKVFSFAICKIENYWQPFIIHTA